MHESHQKSVKMTLLLLEDYVDDFTTREKVPEQSKDGTLTVKKGIVNVINVNLNRERY